VKQQPIRVPSRLHLNNPRLVGKWRVVSLSAARTSNSSPDRHFTVIADLASGFELESSGDPGPYGMDRHFQPYCFPQETCHTHLGNQYERKDRSLAGHAGSHGPQNAQCHGPQHGYGIARRIEQTSDGLLSINHGTLYPVLLKLEQGRRHRVGMGHIENNRRAKFYRITRAGRKQLASEVTQWAQATEIVARFIALKGLESMIAHCAALGIAYLEASSAECGRRSRRELDSHIRLLAEEDIRRGIPPEEAHRRAKLKFGSVESTKESYRDQRGMPALDIICRISVMLLRGIRKNPGFATVAIFRSPRHRSQHRHFLAC